MKRIFTFGLLAAAAFALTNCAQKESYAPEQGEAQNVVPFELVVKLPAETKTYNDGISTKWSAPDTIKVQFSAKMSSLLSSTFIFDCEAGDGVFKGHLNSFWGDAFATIGWADIKAYYPHNSNGVPASTEQDGYNSMSHLAGANCPLYAELTAAQVNSLGGNGFCTTDALTLGHTTSVIEVAVKNGTTEAINVNEVDFLVGDEVKATTVVKNAGALAAGETAKVYVVVEPFTSAEADQLSFTVNDTFVKNIKATSVTFTAGKVKTVNFVVE